MRRTASECALLALTGKPLFDKIKQLAFEQIDKKACFPAGTLVHTKEGLRPIEEIKVGDYVLSKPENGGELAYKRVSKTFVRENAEVFGMEYSVTIDGKGNLKSVITTAEHPFWVPTLRVKDPSVKYGGMSTPHGKWVTPAEMFKVGDNYYKGKTKFYDGHYLSTYDGKEHMVHECGPICMATNSTRSRYTYTGLEYGVVWPLSLDFQREAHGGGLILHNPHRES